MILHNIEHSLTHALVISAFVLSMMVLIEYLTIGTRNKFFQKISENTWTQIIVAAIMGIIPGCLGTFIVVSLYSKKIFNFPALVTAMIASSGDETFVMFSEIPKQVPLIIPILFVIALSIGFLLNIFMKYENFMKIDEKKRQKNHKSEQYIRFNKKKWATEMKKISFQRAAIIITLSLVLIFLIAGKIGPEEWTETKIIMIIIGIVALFIATTVPNNFLVEHLWKHTIKEHLPKIFLWTFAALLFIEIALPLFNISQENFEPIAQKYHFLILIVALLVGFIPESGPNLVFVFLFASGFIPLSILIANSIVQDGHGGLPLLAESPKTFIFSKMINIAVGLIFGVTAYFLGF